MYYFGDFISSGNCFLFAMKTYQGHRNIKMVDSYIEQKHLSDDIKSEKHNTVQKRGLLQRSCFKDEPHMTYVIQPIGTRKGIFAEGFDTETKKVLKMQNIIILTKILNLNFALNEN